jgi:hypothetical protein
MATMTTGRCTADRPAVRGAARPSGGVEDMGPREFAILAVAAAVIAVAFAVVAALLQPIVP